MAASMAGDELVFSMSSESQGSPMIFIKKDYLSILDNNNSQYQSNQSVIDSSQLSNSNKYMDYQNGNLIVPLLITLTQNAAGVTLPPLTTALADGNTIVANNYNCFCPNTSATKQFNKCRNQYTKRNCSPCTVRQGVQLYAMRLCGRTAKLAW